jgi:hypothetical protein
MGNTANHASPCRQLTGAVALALLLSASGTPVLAQRSHKPPPTPWRGHIERFHEHDWHLWRNGHWARTRHDGRMGWWWVVGSSWYFYPLPVYPYPNPWEPAPVPEVSPTLTTPPPTAYWYYCEAARGYYPYVPACAGGWTPVPATPAPSR